MEMNVNFGKSKRNRKLIKTRILRDFRKIPRNLKIEYFILVSVLFQSISMLRRFCFDPFHITIGAAVLHKQIYYCGGELTGGVRYIFQYLSSFAF